MGQSFIPACRTWVKAIFIISVIRSWSGPASARRGTDRRCCPWKVGNSISSSDGMLSGSTPAPLDLDFLGYVEGRPKGGRQVSGQGVSAHRQDCGVPRACPDGKSPGRWFLRLCPAAPHPFRARPPVRVDSADAIPCNTRLLTATSLASTALMVFCRDYGLAHHHVSFHFDQVPRPTPSDCAPPVSPSTV